MRILGAITLVLLGVVAGWFLRISQEEKSAGRSERSAELRETSGRKHAAIEQPGLDPAPERGSEAGQEPAPGDSTAPAESDVPEAEGEGQGEPEQEQMAQFAQFLRGALPLIKMQSKREAQDEAALLAKLLQLAPHRQKQLAEALEKDAVRQLDHGLLPLLEGNEPDAEMLANLEENDGLTKALESDLSLILNTNEMEQVREHYREKEAAARREQMESAFTELAIPDLTEDQERQVREVIRVEVEGDDEVEIPKSQSALKDRLKGGLTKEAMVAAVDEHYRARREKLSRFLTPEQLAHLDRRHEAKKQETEAAAGLMSGLFGLSGNVKVRLGGTAPGEPEAEKKDG